jgi:hypothetical protein
MVNTMGAPCSSAAVGRRKQALAVQRRKYRKDFEGWASNPLVDMEERPLLSCLNCHYSHLRPTGSNRHLVLRLEESERC